MPGRLVATFDYTDEGGTLLYQVCRCHPKDFKQRRPDASKPDGWSWDLRDVRRVPYRLPELVNPATQGQPVLVAEGEGKADLLRSLGFVATCCSGGAGKWDYRFGGFLFARRVVVFPDLDEPGLMHAGQVAASAIMFGAESVRIVTEGMGWDTMPPKSDVKDWLSGVPSDERKGRIVELVKMQAEWKPC